MSHEKTNARETLGRFGPTWDKLINLAVQRGIIVYLVDRLAEKTGVQGLWTTPAGLRLIFIDHELSQHDRNFTMAHELGHDFLHSNNKQLCFKNVNITFPELENEAEQFATRLLEQLDHINCLEEVSA